MGSVPMPTCALKATEKLASWLMDSAMMAEVTLSISRPPYASGMSTRHQAEFAGLAQQAAGDGEVLGLDLGGRGHDLVGGELGGGLGDLPVLFGEVLRW